MSYDLPKFERSMSVEQRGIVAYSPMLEEQRVCHGLVSKGCRHDTLYLLEHEPVITKGRNSLDEHVIVSDDVLKERGIDVYETGRGGDVTYHGPGQIVGYPIFSLQAEERDIRRFVWCLEEVLIRSAASFGVDAHRVDGLRGIWVGSDKLAAIGVRISRWTTMHGFALNVSNDLGAFDVIVPCGLRDKGVTSLQAILGRAPPMDQVRQAIVRHVSDLFKRSVLQEDRDPCMVAVNPVEFPKVRSVAGTM